MFGRWDLISQGFSGLDARIQSSAVWGQRKAAELIVKTAKAHINNQDLGWVPRSATTHSGDNRILVDTESYYGAIKAWKQGSTYHAGVPTSAVNTIGTPIYVYAIAHEYGLGRVPARPLWRPTLKELGGKKGLQMIVKAAIAKKILELKNKGFDVKT